MNDSSNPALIAIAKEAIEEYDNERGNARCNDYELPDTPENRLIYDEWQAHLWQCPVDKVKDHNEYFAPSFHRGKLCCHDMIQIYVLKRLTGLLVPGE